MMCCKINKLALATEKRRPDPEEFSEEWLHGRGVKNVARLMDVLMPGF